MLLESRIEHSLESVAMAELRDVVSPQSDGEREVQIK